MSYHMRKRDFHASTKRVDFLEKILRVPMVADCDSISASRFEDPWVLFGSLNLSLRTMDVIIF